MLTNVKAQNNDGLWNRLTGTSLVNNNTLKEQVLNQYFNPSLTEYYVPQNSGIIFDTDSMTISQYENSNLQVISVPEISSSQITLEKRSLQILVNNGSVTTNALIVRINPIANQSYECIYSDISLQQFASAIARDGDVLEVGTYSYTPINNAQRGFWRCWGECIRVGFNSFVNGNPVNSGVGLLCWVFGAACATGAALGCVGACL